MKLLGLCVLILAATASQATAANDEFDQFIKSQGLLWQNGIYHPIELADDAPMEVLVDAMNKEESLGLGNFRILKIRKLEYPAGAPGSRPLIGVLVRGEDGRRSIILAQSGGRSWWNRIYSLGDPPRYSLLDSNGELTVH